MPRRKVSDRKAKDEFMLKQQIQGAIDSEDDTRTDSDSDPSWTPRADVSSSCLYQFHIEALYYCFLLIDDFRTKKTRRNVKAPGSDRLDLNPSRPENPIPALSNKILPEVIKKVEAIFSQHE